MQQQVNLFWFRRDLRLHDNAGLYHALKNKLPVVPIFIFDKHILDELEERGDKRVQFIFDALNDIQKILLEHKSTLDCRYGTPEEVFPQLIKAYNVQGVFTNTDYEPYARSRDEKIEKLLKKSGVSFHSYKDHVILEKGEVLKDDGRPYTVFTPYSRRWKAVLTPFHLKSYPVKKYFSNIHQQSEIKIPSLESMGFVPVSDKFPPKNWKEDVIAHYDKTRDTPGINGTSRLGIHLRFGTVSIRELARKASELNATYLSELIWRDFYQMILWHFPQVQGNAFKPASDQIKWRNNEKEFEAWCNGMTGYPIVDAGMRELNETGFMHNRVRMIVASFLTKHLLIDWRWGEAYFAKKLLDYDLAANNGGWQWAAGSGCDAAPYFRIFNPYLQTKKFDPDLVYIRKWVPELDELSYPQPIVQHEKARERCLAAYSAALKK